MDQQSIFAQLLVLKEVQRLSPGGSQVLSGARTSKRKHTQQASHKHLKTEILTCLSFLASRMQDTAAQSSGFSSGDTDVEMQEQA